MFDSKIDSLFDIPMLDLLVNDYTDCTLGNVVDDTSLAVIDFVRHTADVLVLTIRSPRNFRSKYVPLLHRSVRFDINDVADSKNRLVTKVRLYCSINTYLYCRKYVDSFIMPFFLKSREKAYWVKVSFHTAKIPSAEMAGPMFALVSGTYPSTGSESSWMTHLDGDEG